MYLECKNNGGGGAHDANKLAVQARRHCNKLDKVQARRTDGYDTSSEHRRHGIPRQDCPPEPDRPTDGRIDDRYELHDLGGQSGRRHGDAAKGQYVVENGGRPRATNGEAKRTRTS